MFKRKPQWEDDFATMISHISKKDIDPYRDDLLEESVKQTEEAFKVTKLSSEEKAAAVSNYYINLFSSHSSESSGISVRKRFFTVLSFVLFILITHYATSNMEVLEINLHLDIQSTWVYQAAVGG